MARCTYWPRCKRPGTIKQIAGFFCVEHATKVATDPIKVRQRAERHARAQRLTRLRRAWDAQRPASPPDRGMLDLLARLDAFRQLPLDPIFSPASASERPDPTPTHPPGRPRSAEHALSDAEAADWAAYRAILTRRDAPHRLLGGE